VRGVAAPSALIAANPLSSGKMLSRSTRIKTLAPRVRGNCLSVDATFRFNEAGLARAIDFINELNFLLQIGWKGARRIA